MTLDLRNMVQVNLLQRAFIQRDPLQSEKKFFPSPLLRETFHNAKKRFDDVDSLYI